MQLRIFFRRELVFIMLVLQVQQAVLFHRYWHIICLLNDCSAFSKGVTVH